MTLDSTILVGIGTLGAAILGVCITFYSTTNARIKALELRMDHLDKNEEKQDAKYDLLLEKIDGYREILTDIRIDLQNKANK